jgi:hypothetical protein
MTEVEALMNLLLMHMLSLKGSDLSAHRMTIMNQKKRYTSIMN